MSTERDNELTRLRKRVRLFEKKLARSERSRATLEDIKDKNQRVLMTVNQQLNEQARALTAKNEELAAALEELALAQSRLVLHEKMASLGSLVAGIAHELNTPAGAVSSAAEVIDRCVDRVLRIVDDPEMTGSRGGKLEPTLRRLKDSTRAMRQGCGRVTSIVRSLQTFAHLDEAEIKQVDLAESVESVLVLVNHELGDRSIEVSHGPVREIHCYPQELNQVLLNLVTNAVHATAEDGRVAIRSYADSTHVHIEISDDGCGISSDRLVQIFDPAFRRREQRVAIGFGLAACYRIAQKHGGTLTATSEVGRGSAFTLTLSRTLDLPPSMRRS